MVDNLKAFLDDLKVLRRDIKAEEVSQIAKKTLRERAEHLGSRWFKDLSPTLAHTSLSAESLEKYSSGSARLIKLSTPNNRKTSYLDTLDGLIKNFRKDLVLPIQSGQLRGAKTTAFDLFFSSIGNPDESEYLIEAVSCAKARFYRAAVVLGWCAAVDRIHRRIEALGFSQFNVRSAWMASQSKGRFKKFNQPQNVNSLSELRRVFDTTILWILEGMDLIDSNQQTRLRSCFDMRCHGAHPGDAPITEFNLLSFFSDLDQIVFSNPKFVI